MRKLLTTALVPALALAFGCASHRLPQPRDCAVIGAAIGAVGGGAGAASYADNHSTGGAVGIGLAATVVGGGIGYAVCYLAHRDKQPSPLPVQHAEIPVQPPSPVAPTAPVAVVPPTPPATPVVPIAPIIAVAPVPPDVCRVATVIEGVNFDLGKTDIRQGAARVLDQVVRDLATCRSLHIRIEGHTDGVGQESDNEVLSRGRASSVRNHLVRGGISSERTNAVGFGERKPIADNASAEGRARNRRVEIHPIIETPAPTQ